MAKKRPGKKTPKPHKESIVVVRDKDGKWWGDLQRTEPANSPEELRRDRWSVKKDEMANNPNYPDLDRRVELERDEKFPDDDGMLPIRQF